MASFNVPTRQMIDEAHTCQVKLNTGRFTENNSIFFKKRRSATDKIKYKYIQVVSIALEMKHK